MNRHIAVSSILVAALMLMAEVPANAQRGGHGGFGGMRGGFGGFSSGHMGGFGGFNRGGFVGRGGFGRGFVGNNGFNRGFNSFPFRSNDFFFNTRLNIARNDFFFGRRFFPHNSFFFGSFGFGPSYSYWPGYSYLPAYGYAGDYPYYPYYPQYGPSYGEEAAPYPGGTGESAGAATAPTYWLVVLKDDATLLVSDYWLDDSTLNYVTRDGKKLSVDLSNVNVELTKTLNRERGLEFQLPRPSGDYQPRRRDAHGRVY